MSIYFSKTSVRKHLLKRKLYAIRNISHKADGFRSLFGGFHKIGGSSVYPVDYLGKSVSLFDKMIDGLPDILVIGIAVVCSGSGIFCELLDLVRNYRKASSGFTGSCCLDRSIKCKQIGLGRDRNYG